MRRHERSRSASRRRWEDRRDDVNQFRRVFDAAAQGSVIPRRPRRTGTGPGSREKISLGPCVCSESLLTGRGAIVGWLAAGRAKRA